MATRTAEKAQLVVSRPEKGDTNTYHIKPGMTVAVHGFTFGDGVATIRGEDLVIQFPDGSQIVLQDFVEVAQYNNPPVLVFDDGTVLPGADVLQQVAALEGAPLEVATATTADADVSKIEPAAGPGANPSNLVGGMGSAANFTIGAIGGDGVAVSARPDNVDFGRGTEGPIQVGGPTGDGNGGNNNPGNTAPNATDSTVVMDEDAGATNLNIPAPTDADGDALTVTINTLPGLGTLTLNGVPVVAGQVLTVAQLQALQFTPNPNANGNTSFTYTVNDGNGGFDGATVNINVNPVNDAPNAYDATLVVDDDAAATNLNIPAPTDVDGDSLTVTINTLPSLGTLMLNGVPVTVGQVLTVAQLQALQFDPANGQFGNTSFTYTVNDGHGGVDTGTVNINVNEQDANQAPNAYDATVVMDEDASATNLNIPAPTDADGDSLTVTINTLPGLGTLTLNGVPVTAGQVLTVAQLQALQFTPGANANGNTSFTYTVNDGHGGNDTATVNINVNPINDAPNAYDATLVVDDDAAATNLNIPAPTDVDGDTLTVTINTLPSLGTLMLNGVPVVAGQVLTVAQLQALQFDPANGQFGNTSFTYTVNDGHGGNDTATVNITVNEQDAANQAPNAYDASVVMNEDAGATALNIPAPTDADGDALTVTINTLPGLGTLTLNGVPVTAGQVLTVAQLQSLQFTPGANANGNTSFTYTVNDGHATDTATVNINVNPVNDAPNAYDASVVMNEDAGATNLNIPAPTDVDGDTLTVTINSLPGLGSLTLNGVAVTVGQVLTVAQLQSLQFTPGHDLNGNTSFTYTVNDGHGGLDTATVNINVNPVNDAPNAYDATLVVDDDAAATNLNIPAPTDVDGDKLSVTINSLPGLGQLLLNGVAVQVGQVLTVAQLQALQFDPANGQFGHTSFTYTVNDGHGGNDTATVNINVNEQDANHAPNAYDATLVVDDDAAATALNIPAPTDADGDALSVTINSLPSLGVLMLNGVAVQVGQVLTVAQLQSLAFDPANNNFGNTSFTYTVNDGHGGVDTGTVNIVVNEQDVAPVNHAPVALDQTVVMDEDAGRVSLNIARPTDSDGDSMTVRIDSLPGLGSLTLNGVAVQVGQTLTIAQLQALSYTPSPDANGNTSFHYTVTDSHGAADGATVNIVINPMPEVPANHAPVALDQTVVMDEDAGRVSLNIARPTDADGDSLTVRIDSLPGLGSLTLNGAAVHVGQELSIAQLQALSYTPNPDANGNSSFHYTVTDSHGASDGATVNIVINPMPEVPANHAPVALDQTVVMNENNGFTDLNIARPTDADGDALTVRIDTVPGGMVLGLLALADGTLVHAGQMISVAQLQDLHFTPFANQSGSVNFSYTVIDSHGSSDSATVRIVVNDIPNQHGPGIGGGVPPIHPVLNSVANPVDDSNDQQVAMAQNALQSAVAEQEYQLQPAVSPLHELAVAIAEQVPSDFADVKGNTWQFDEAHVEVEFGKTYVATVSEEAPAFSGHVVAEVHQEQISVVALWDTLPMPEPVQPYHAA